MNNVNVPLKAINVKARNIILQIPAFVVKNWGSEIGDFVDMELMPDGNIILKPRKREVDNGEST